MKRILIAVALSIATIGAAHAQSQTAVLNSQFRFQGQNKSFDLATAKKITFVTSSGSTSQVVVTDHDGVQRSGSISLTKLLANSYWKGYVSQTPFVYINTMGANFDCTNSQTVISWAGRAPEAVNDNCALMNKIISQSDTN